MIRYDAQGRVSRSFWPHLVLLAGGLAGAAWDWATSGGFWVGLVAGEILEPVTLLLAGVAGWWLTKHRWLLPALLAIGAIVGFGVTAVSFENPGRAAHFSLVLARIAAVVLTGYAFNAARLAFDPPAPRI